MSQTDSQAQQIAELKKRLEEEIEEKRELEALIGEKESEAECAAAWAQTASETVVVLEEQLDKVEAELDSALERLRAYENDENPWRSKEESFKHILEQLNESQTREAEMFQQAEDMQRTLVEVQAQLADRNDLCTRHEAEISKLKMELAAGEHCVSELVSECSSTASTWERYTKVKGDMDRTLGNHLATAGMNGYAAAVHQAPSIETYRLEDRAYELEQMLSQVETNLLEEKNKRAKLQDENESLHKYVLKLQEQLYSAQSAD